MAATKTRKSNKGEIVVDWDIFVDREGADFKTKTTKIPHSKSNPNGAGIYALYDNHGLYYVGLTDYSLRGRIQKHTQDHHKGKWERFSWYQIPKLTLTKDIETILLSIIDPKGNKVKGKFMKKKRKSEEEKDSRKKVVKTRRKK
jgi:predicted GIY-YIG superfamily endonuclease